MLTDISHWRGPEITWHTKDIKDMVKTVGKEAAIDRLIGDTFTREYVGRVIDEIMKQDDSPNTQENK